MRLTLGFTLLISFTKLGFSCEPATVDWTGFMAAYDKDVDGFISSSEFINVRDFQPYDFPGEKTISYKELFKFLDTDNNGRIDRTEFFRIYQILPNGCVQFGRNEK